VLQQKEESLKKLRRVGKKPILNPSLKRRRNGKSPRSRHSLMDETIAANLLLRKEDHTSLRAHFNSGHVTDTQTYDSDRTTTTIIIGIIFTVICTALLLMGGYV